MDWTSWNGRQRPVEEDALRLLTIVHQLGAPSLDDGFSTYLAGERRLQQLDHLVRRPIDLAFVLIAGHAGTPDGVTPDRAPGIAELPREIRRLVTEARARRPAGESLDRFEAGGWERWDDVWACLGCRRLLEVGPAGGAGGIGFRLTDEGARHLEGLYASVPDLGTYRARCRAVRRYLLAELDGRAGSGALTAALREAHRRIDAYRVDEHLAPEDDLLSRFFQSTFGERL